MNSDLQPHEQSTDQAQGQTPLTGSHAMSMSDSKAGPNGWRTFGIVIITVVITLGIGYWVAKSYLFQTSFTPVTLNEKEQLRLDQKIERLGGNTPTNNGDKLEPEPYSEAGASREVHFSENELNALLAKNTNLAN